MKLLVLGGTGQVGWELMRALQPLGKVVAASREVLDLRSSDAIARWMNYMQPDVVVNAAAYTFVDRAESETTIANAVNATAVGHLAEECRRSGALLVHYSTDYVFDGESDGLYREDAIPCPVNVYGASKLKGEQLIAQSGCRHLILRLCWVYSLRRANFLLSIIDRAKTASELRVVNDQLGAPTPAWLIADLTAHLIQRRQCDSEVRSFDGIVNVACTGFTSWHGFATAIVDSLVAKPSIRHRFRLDRRAPIVAIPSSELKLRARRPRDARLDLGRLRDELNLFPPSWETALALTLRDA
jgi:dTDP-4-dehydrorhamnose reductase